MIDPGFSHPLPTRDPLHGAVRRITGDPGHKFPQDDYEATKLETLPDPKVNTNFITQPVTDTLHQITQAMGALADIRTAVSISGPQAEYKEASRKLLAFVKAATASL